MSDELISPHVSQELPDLSTALTGTAVSPSIGRLLQNYKFSPATMAFKFENLNVQPGQKLKWLPANHLMYISLRVAQTIAKGNGRLIISAPPRHGKSKLCTHYGPLWVLENFDNQQVTLVTYGADLSEDFAREVRETIDQSGDLLDVKIKREQRSIAKFQTTKGGSMTSIGIGGAYTGRGSHVLFIDDYIKTLSEALSPTTRQQTWDWFTTTPMTRLEPDASVIIIATRWHSDDLIGRILKHFPGEWEYISIPAIAKKDDLLGRKEGQPLFPERYGLKSLNERKKFLGSMYFDAIYQQDPRDDTGKLAKRSWLLPALPHLPSNNLRMVRVWDTAGTEQGGDYTAGGLYAYDRKTQTVYLVDMIRFRTQAAEVERRICQTAEDDGHDTEIIIEQETGSAGKAVAERYCNVLLKDFKASPHYSNKSKLVRAQPMLAGAEDKKFRILEGKWNDDFLNEFEAFPPTNRTQHDDQIDTASTAYNYLTGKKHLSASVGRSQKKLSPAEKLQAQIKRQEALYENQPFSPIPGMTAARMKADNNYGRTLKPPRTARFGAIRGATFGRS